MLKTSIIIKLLEMPNPKAIGINENKVGSKSSGKLNPKKLV